MSLKVRGPSVTRWPGSTQRARFGQQLSSAKAVGGVEVKEPGRGPAYGPPAGNRGAVPDKVVLPTIGAWLEEPGDDPGVRVDTGEAGALPEVTFGRGQNEVLDAVGAAVLAGQDVLDVEPQRRVALGHPAALAAEPGTVADELPRRCVHQFGEEGFSVAWAWALRIPRNVFARTMASSSCVSSRERAP